MSAHEIAAALCGKRAGNCWMARCPAHDDSTASLAISESKEGRVLVHCHAGCLQAAVIAALEERGLWSRNKKLEAEGAGDRHRRKKASLADSERRRTAHALQIWCASFPIEGTAGAAYLQRRGLSMPLPNTLRFHPTLKHPTAGLWPGVVGLIVAGVNNIAIGIHRTFLTPGGQSKAPIEPNKMMLGPCRGGVVRLAPTSKELMVGEGIETCLAAMKSTGKSAWAALSTSGLRNLQLPDDVRLVTILADGDEPGEAAAVTAATRWQREGRHVRIARPPAGCDFNDVLCGCRSGRRDTQ